MFREAKSYLQYIAISHIEDEFRFCGVCPAIVGIFPIENSQLNKVGTYLILVPLRMVQEVKFEIFFLDFSIHLLNHAHSHPYFYGSLWYQLFFLLFLYPLMELTFFK
jgi:hypothetical protein